MAKNINALWGAISGKIGNLVWYIRHGIQYIRIKPAKYHDKKSPEQLAQRKRMAACQALYHTYKDTIFRPIWNKKAVGKSGYNLFLHFNTMMFDGKGNIADYDNLKIAIGDLPLPTNITASITDEGKSGIGINWTDNSDECLASPTDILRIVVICRKNRAKLDKLLAQRQDEQAIIQLPFIPDDTVHLYVFFQNIDKSAYSDSIHVPVEISLS